VAQIYPRALGFLSVASYDLQGGVLSRLHTGLHFGHLVGVGVLLAADSQSTSAVWVSGLPLGPSTRF
jgi:hypothetical protein